MDEQEPLDREIDALLGVEPSRDFLARVRAGAHAQPIAAREWMAGRWLAIAGSAIALVLAFSIWRARVEPPSPPPPLAPGVTVLELPPPIVIDPITIAPLLTADLELGEQQ